MSLSVCWCRLFPLVGLFGLEYSSTVPKRRYSNSVNSTSVAGKERVIPIDARMILSCLSYILDSCVVVYVRLSSVSYSSATLVIPLTCSTRLNSRFETNRLASNRLGIVTFNEEQLLLPLNKKNTPTEGGSGGKEKTRRVGENIRRMRGIGV